MNKTPQEIARERAEVMLHFANGGKVESAVLSIEGEEWTPCKEPSWDWRHCDYRRAVEPMVLWAVVFQDGSAFIAKDEASAIEGAKTWERKARAAKFLEVQ